MRTSSFITSTILHVNSIVYIRRSFPSAGFSSSNSRMARAGTDTALTLGEYAVPWPSACITVWGCPTTNVLDLFSFLPFLRNLSLICSRRRTDYKPTFTFHVGKLGRVLHPLRNTLETLTLFIGRQDDYCSEDGIGSLHRFKAMKQLRIQSHVLLG